jgi:GNAT superfamily N-acetyltransferase
MAVVLKEHGDKPAYSSAVLAVHPDHQGKGIGRAINDYTARTVSNFPQDLLYFGSCSIYSLLRRRITAAGYSSQLIITT